MGCFSSNTQELPWNCPGTGKPVQESSDLFAAGEVQFVGIALNFSNLLRRAEADDPSTGRCKACTHRLLEVIFSAEDDDITRFGVFRYVR